MKKYLFLAIAVLLLLTVAGCSKVKSNTPPALLAWANSGNLQDFNVVETHRFSALNDADVRNGVSEKWCIAYTYTENGTDIHLYMGVARLVVLSHGDWTALDSQVFSSMDELPAEQTSCDGLIEKYAVVGTIAPIIHFGFALLLSAGFTIVAITYLKNKRGL